MTKSEIITRIITRITDPWEDRLEDYQYAKPIDLNLATGILKTCRDDDEYSGLEPDERMPEDATPELLMEAYNCNIRYKKHELRTSRLAEFITDNEMVCEYVNYYAPDHDPAMDLIPVDFLRTTKMFPFPVRDTYPDCLTLITIGQVSVNTFDPGDEFCWFDNESEILHSTSTPFADGILDAEAFARFVLSDTETLSYFVNDLMDEDNIQYVFGCSSAELKKEMNL